MRIGDWTWGWEWVGNVRGFHNVNFQFMVLTSTSDSMVAPVGSFPDHCIHLESVRLYMRGGKYGKSP